jgi:acyl-CoA reductase-like NAD-dependent aldehyde dehydrogenase
MRRDLETLAAIEALDNGKTFEKTKTFDVPGAIGTFEYFAGFAEKISGEVIDSAKDKFVYTVREPIGVVGATTPFNFPLAMVSWKLAPALITGKYIMFVMTSNYQTVSSILQSL